LVDEAGADVESKDGVGLTALSHAAASGHLEIVKWLVKEAGAKVESKDGVWGRTALSWEAAFSHVDSVKFLVKEAGADVESKDEWEQTALDLARQGAQEQWHEDGCRAVVAWLEKKARGEADD
jgi:ankyrin repeat protein